MTVAIYPQSIISGLISIVVTQHDQRVLAIVTGVLSLTTGILGLRHI